MRTATGALAALVLALLAACAVPTSTREVGFSAFCAAHQGHGTCP